MPQLEEKGVLIKYNAGVSKVSGVEKALTGIECVSLETGEKELLPADTLVIASGRFPELAFVRVKEETENEEGEVIEASEEDADAPLAWEGIEMQKNTRFQ